jgi:hypothetical protein
MSVNRLIGSHLVSGDRWNHKVEISLENVGYAPPEEFLVDPTLPVQYTDPFDPAGGVVIPMGRFVSIGKGSSRFLSTDTGKTPVTIHDGKNFTPVGMSTSQVFKQAPDFMTNSNVRKFKRGFFAEVPYVTSVNAAHGTPRAGDKVTGYWGGTTSTTVINYKHRGKPVLWNPKKLYTATFASSASFDLPAAIYPGITPRLVAAFSGSGGVSVSVASPTLVFTGSVWRATLGAAVTEVWYEWGQEADQIGGEIIRIQSLSDMLNRDDFLKWVEVDNYPLPKALQRYPVTAVSEETPSTVVADSQYRVVNYPMSIHHPVTVEIKGTIVDTDGVSTTYSSDWYTLPSISSQTVRDMRTSFIGLYHTINWNTGLIELAGNITSVTAIRVTYSYYTDWRDGAPLWGGGVENLTDGRYVNQVSDGRGLPAHLNLADVVAAMRIMVA